MTISPLVLVCLLIDIPREAIDQGSAMDFSQIPDISNTKPTRKLFSNTTVIWNESHLLMRMMYKSKNELRQWKSYKKAQEFQRCLKRIAHLEMWFNTTQFDFKSDHDLEMIIGYLDALERLIDTTREVALSSFFHHQILCQQGLFVQKTMIVAPVIARISYFLGRLKSELPPIRQKYLKEITSEVKRTELASRFNLALTSLIEEEEDAVSQLSTILVTSQLKEKRGPPQFQYQKKNKKQKNNTGQSTATAKGHEIDDIFGAD